MIKSMVWCCALGWCVLSGSALAEDSLQARQAAADRYSKLVPVEKMYSEMLAQISQELPAADREVFRSEMKKLFRAEAVERISREALVKTFTADELNALADFYSSKHGASVMGKMSAYSANMMPALHQEMAGAMQNMQQRARRK